MPRPRTAAVSGNRDRPLESRTLWRAVGALAQHGARDASVGDPRGGLTRRATAGRTRAARISA